MERFVCHEITQRYGMLKLNPVYIIFLVWDSFEIVMLYLFLVETKGLTLEEIEDVFSQPNPRKYSVELRSGAVASPSGHV
jgi:hypothetical protein